MSSLNKSVVWDKFHVFQGRRGKTSFIDIGTSPQLKPNTYPNPIKEAIHYRWMLDSGKAKSQADLAHRLGVSRARVTQMMNLLKLDEEIQEFILGLEDTDKRLKVLTERRLRSLVQNKEAEIQRELFWNLARSDDNRNSVGLQ